MKTAQKNITAFGHSLNEMNNKTYTLRRNVIDLIYEAKKFVSLPRIEVRIVSGGKENNCGYAYLNENIIHIHDKYVNGDQNMLKHVVLHEIVHAVLGIDHDETNDLMCAIVPNDLDVNKSVLAFKKYFDNKQTKKLHK